MKFQIHIRFVLHALHRMSANCFTLPDNASIARYCFKACASDPSMKQRELNRRTTHLFSPRSTSGMFFLLFHTRAFDRITRLRCRASRPKGMTLRAFRPGVAHLVRLEMTGVLPKSQSADGSADAWRRCIANIPFARSIPRIGIKIRASYSGDLTIRASPLTHSI
jgi:hypothetical protein